ncbi:MAG: glycerophosphodiester phosphodiesterase family protein [Gemmatimonadota bacterium]|nr:glycerophosphodiester phosphodiesterase family protein [Gemmatimonadota bacterium]
MNNIRKPAIIGHRGAGHLAPENTMAAINMAVESNLDAVELDIQASADHALVIFHDERLDRTTDGTGILNEWSLEALRRLDAGAWFDARYQKEPIPILAEVLPCFPDGLMAFLELKNQENVEPLGTLISHHHAEEWCVALSFSDQILQHVSDLFPTIKRAYIHHPQADVSDLLNRITSLPADFIGLFPPHMVPENVEPCRQAGLQILTGPVNDMDTLHKMLFLSPDYILSDRPDLIQNALYPTP